MKILTEVEDSAVLRQLRKMPKSVTRPVREAVLMGAHTVRGEMLRSMQQERKTGRVYPIRAKGGQKTVRTYTASAPGEAPAVRSGNLLSNIHVETEDSGLTAYVGVLDLARVDYAVFLEYGTRTMEPRPFIEPALEKHAKDIQRDIEAAVKEALGNA